MRSVTVSDRQTFFDIAMLSNGKAEAALVLAFAVGRCITDVLTSGEKIEVFETVFYDEEVVRDLRAREAKPATGDSDNYIQTNVDEGIGFWYLEIDFKVS